MALEELTPFAAILITIYILRGVIWMCVAPPLEMWDEFQHVAYFAYLDESRHIPIFGQAAMPQAVFAETIKWPQAQYAYDQLNGSGARTYSDYWERVPPVVTPGDHLPRFYESQQAPLYYQLLLPVYRLAGGTADLRKTVAFLRGANLLISAAGLAVILLWLGRVTPDRTHFAIMGLWIVLQPLFLLNAVRVANDALAVTIGCIAMVAAMNLRPRHIFWQAAGLGALIGVGGLVKTTDLALGLPAATSLSAWHAPAA